MAVLRGVSRRCERLEIRVLDPSFDNALIIQIFKLLENKEADHQPGGLSGAVRMQHKAA